jgi:hypothetical protein
VAEIYYLIDGSKLIGYEINGNTALRQMILEACEQFHRKVMEGMEIVANEFNPELRDKALAEIEPEPDSTASYEDFQSEVYKRKQAYVRIEGTKEMLEIAMAYKDLQLQEKMLKDPKQYRRNQIWQILQNNNASVIDFGQKGKVTYSDKLYVNVHE